MDKYLCVDIPADQQWENAHYPMPECLGGTKMIKLWSRDHSVHGVLQSEEFNHPCLCWKATNKDRENILAYYPEYLPLFEKWQFELRSRAGKIGGATTKRKGLGIFGLTPEERIEAGRRANRAMKPETRSKGGKTAGMKTLKEKTGVHGRTPQQMAEDGRKGALKNIEEKTGRYSPEALSKNGKLGGIATSKRRFKCSITGHISTAAGLANYQRARNIDVNLRTEISNNEG